MQRNPRAYLLTIIEEGEYAMSKVEGRTLAEYQADRDFRLIIERLLINVGDAVVQLKAADSSFVEQLSYVREIVGFRNIAVHGYYMLDHARVWDICQNYLPQLVAEAKELY